jgi:LacI family transcriptional regulator
MSSPTLKDVAKLAKVSVTTASFALNGKPMKAETRDRVLEAAKKLHYYVNVNGRNLSTNRTHNISFVVLNETPEQDYTANLNYYYPFLKGIMDLAQEKQYTVKYEANTWKNIQSGGYFERMVYGHNVDGVIIVPQYMFSCDFIQLFEKENFPYVIINPWFQVNRKHKVIINNFLGGMFAADFIIRKKYRNIYMINGPKYHISASEIERGFLTSLLYSGISFDVSKILYSDYTFDGGFLAMQSFMKSSDLKDAIVFCANDNMATGAMKALKGAGLRIPDDVALMGFDGQEIAEVVTPTLTTMAVDTHRVGMESTKRLLGMIENDPNQKFYCEVSIVPELVERQSTARKIV